MSSSDFQTQRNKFLSRAGETVATKSIRLGADIFKAFLNFLKEMFYTVIGK